MRRKKERFYKSFNPGKYMMACCPYCRGIGRSFNKDAKVKVCSQCGGFGWVKKEN